MAVSLSKCTSTEHDAFVHYFGWHACGQTQRLFVWEVRS
jgi:hypothetical protein